MSVVMTDSEHYKTVSPIFLNGMIQFSLGCDSSSSGSYFACSFRTSDNFGWYQLSGNQRMHMASYGYSLMVRNNNEDSATPVDNQYFLYRFQNWKKDLLGVIDVSAPVESIDDIKILIGKNDIRIKIWDSEEEEPESWSLTVLDSPDYYYTPGHVAFTVSEPRADATPSNAEWELYGIDIKYYPPTNNKVGY